jgi:hypothetical protein
MLRRFQIDRAFDAVASSDELPVDKALLGKSQTHLLACQRLGVAPSRALVIEDTSAGVNAARKAGLLVGGFRNGFNDREDFSSAHFVIHRLSELLALLMRGRVTVILALLIVGLAHAETAETPLSEAAVAKAWAEFATPNENHKRLGAFVGKWKIHVSFWPTPDAVAQESDGTAELRWVLGGRYLEQRQKVRMMGGLMSGIGYLGYDNIKRRYVSVWLDNLGTSILQTWGTSDPTGKVIKTQGTIDDMVTRKPLRYEDAMTLVDRDTFTYEARTSRPDSDTLYRVMEIVYTRR